MKRLFAVAVAATLAMPAFAQDMDPNITARKAHMSLIAYNLGVLGGMAQGRMDYDAQVAATAAANLHAYTQVDTTRMWAAGTAMGQTEGTRLLPAAFDNMADFMARFDALEMAAANLASVAGTDLAALQGAMGGVGASCGGCHQTYRQSN